MKQDFLKEWGPAILTAIAILIMLFIIRSFKEPISNNFKQIVDSLQTSVTDELNLTKAK